MDSRLCPASPLEMTKRASNRGRKRGEAPVIPYCALPKIFKAQTVVSKIVPIALRLTFRAMSQFELNDPCRGLRSRRLTALHFFPAYPSDPCG